MLKQIRNRNLKANVCTWRFNVFKCDEIVLRWPLRSRQRKTYLCLFWHVNYYNHSKRRLEIKWDASLSNPYLFSLKNTIIVDPLVWKSYWIISLDLQQMLPLVKHENDHRDPNTRMQSSTQIPHDPWGKFTASISPARVGGWGGVFVLKFGHVFRCWLDIGVTVNLKHGYLYASYKFLSVYGRFAYVLARVARNMASANQC